MVFRFSVSVLAKPRVWIDRSDKMLKLRAGHNLILFHEQRML
jgi:hypothetical protein